MPTARRARATLAVLALAIAATAFTAAPALATTTVKTPVISEVSYDGAHLDGEVNTEGNLSLVKFEYSTDEQNWTQVIAGAVQGGGPSEFVPFETNLTGLKGGTKYYVRLLATEGFLPTGTFSPKPNPSFTTLTPDPTTVISTDNASQVTYTQAKASGEIDRPVKSNDVTCNFEYIPDDAYAANPVDNRFAGATPVPCEPENPVKATGHVPVTAKFAGLSPSTTYHLRLAISNAFGPDSKEAANTFTTLGPVPVPSVLKTANATAVEYTVAHASGELERPGGPGAQDPALDTTCTFEYISDDQFTANQGASAPPFEGATPIPCDPPNPITDPGTPTVSATLTGLAASTTYHLRLSASNQGGADAKDAAATFTTAGPIPKPSVLATDDATDLNVHEATVKGEVQRPAGADPALDINCRFEYVTQAQFEAEEFAAAQANGQLVGCVENPITEATADSEGKQKVSAQLGGLKAGTTFHLRLVAENGGGTDTKESAATFTTLPAELPSATIDPVEGGTFTTARVSGTVDIRPDQLNTWVAYEISTDNKNWSYPYPGFINPPSPAGGIVDVERTLTGLQPSTTYFIRIGAAYYTGYAYEKSLEDGEVAFSPTETITTEPLPPPTAEALAVTDITATTAHFSATVDPHAPAGPLSQLAKKAFATKWHFECTPECKDTNGNEIGGTVQGEEGEQPVFGDVKRLDPNTCYEVRLVIHSEGGDETVVETFCTPLIKPTVKASPGGSDGKGGYVLQGTVNPNNSPVSDCTFAWGPEAHEELDEYAFQADCSPMPGEGAKALTVEAPLTGLTPDANYNFRLFATNEAGTEKSENLIFKPTLAKTDPCANEQLRTENNSNALPECRAYEMVTPPGKEGAGSAFATFDGGARVAYTSEATNLAKSGQSLPLGVNRYVAARTPAGWETIPNLNGSSGSLYDAPTFAIPDGDPARPIAYSPDLLSSVWKVTKKDCFRCQYLRNPDGTFELIGSAKLGGVFTPPVAVSADLSHLLTWGNAGLLVNPSGPGVYEFIGAGTDQPRRVDLDNSDAPISTCLGTGSFNFSNAANQFISSDGSRIVNDVFGGCGAANPPADELWARVNGTTAVDVSASHCTRLDCNAPARSTFLAASADGSRALFFTTQQLVDADTDQTNDIYACDIPSGNPAPTADKANPCAAFRQVSGAQTGAKVEFVEDQFGVRSLPGATVSEDGSTAYFVAQGVLASNEDALKEKAVAGDHNLYVWRTDAAHPDGQTTFLARLDSIDLSGNNARGGGPQTTPDGRYLVFTTTSQLLPTDTDSARDVYRYDADTGDLTRVSTNVFGVAGNGDFDAAIATPTEHNPSSTVSDDGTKIVFTTTEALSPADGNAEPDVYLWTPARVSLISTGSSGSAPRDHFDEFNSPKVAIAPSGEDIYFESAQALTPADGDGSNDVYDARIGGGFSFAPPSICTGENCQPPASTSPAVPTPAANRPKQVENVKPPKPCPKGKVRRHGKCVPKHKKHHKKSHKEAGHNRGGSK